MTNTQDVLGHMSKAEFDRLINLNDSTSSTSKYDVKYLEKLVKSAKAMDRGTIELTVCDNGLLFAAVDEKTTSGLVLANVRLWD